MTEERFFEQLRRDAWALRYEPDEQRLRRIEAAVRMRLAEEPPTVAQLLALWFRPLAASLTALAVAAILAVTLSGRGADLSTEPIEVSIGGASYSVGE
ncbi:MAG TPA: hypothetical protein VF618_24835 [Thermoanaerobaculia bacterium]